MARGYERCTGNQIPAQARTAVHVRDRWRCQRCGTATPSPKGHWHHRRSRSVRDGLEHSPGNGITLCPNCHAAVHAHPFEARRHGYIVSRFTADPATIPYRRWDNTWWLTTHDGAVIAAHPPDHDEHR